MTQQFNNPVDWFEFGKTHPVFPWPLCEKCDKGIDKIVMDINFGNDLRYFEFSCHEEKETFLVPLYIYIDIVNYSNKIDRPILFKDKYHLQWKPNG